MIKKLLLVGALLSGLAFSDENKWFMELGWKISAPTQEWSYNSFDTDGQRGVHYDGEGTDDMLYASVGYLFDIQNSDVKVALSAGTTFILLDAADHRDAVFTKASLLYPANWFDTSVLVGPTVSAYFPYNSYYYDPEDGEFARKVKNDIHTAYSFGVDTIWGDAKWKYTFGLEYMTSAVYSGKVVGSTGYADSYFDGNGLYAHTGIQYTF